MNFTIEEMHLMCIYDTSSKNKLLSDINESLEYVYEPEMLAIMDNVIHKLNRISDEEFSDIVFMTDL